MSARTRHGREPRRRAKTPVVAVRAFDTAGAKAGAARGCEKPQHGSPTRAAVRREPRLSRHQAIEQVAIRPIDAQKKIRDQAVVSI